MNTMRQPEPVRVCWATPAGHPPVDQALHVDAIRLSLTVLGDTTNAASVTCLQVIGLCRAIAAMHAALVLAKANDRSIMYRAGEARRDGQQPPGLGERWETPREIVERLFVGGDL